MKTAPTPKAVKPLSMTPAAVKARTRRQAALQTVADSTPALVPPPPVEVVTPPAMAQAAASKTRRQLAVCSVCGVRHQRIEAYLGRNARRPFTSPEMLAWMAQHGHPVGPVSA